MGIRRIAAFLAAVIVAAAALPARSAKAYGETYNIRLEWSRKLTLVNDRDHLFYSGFYDVEYDEHGDPFYRFEDEIIYVDPDSISDELRFLQIRVDEDACLAGDEFRKWDVDNRYFVYEVTGWSTTPHGGVEIRKNQPLWQVRDLLQDGMTLYPVEWKRLPSIYYHNSDNGEIYVSPGGYTEDAATEVFEGPYHYLTGWAEEPGGPVKYRFQEQIEKTEKMDLYSVWAQSRISDIPPVFVPARQAAEHIRFGGRSWRKIGADEEKALLVYDEMMYVGGDYEKTMIRDLYNEAMDCCTNWYSGFSGAERAAVCSTDKGEDSDTTIPLQEAKLFLLSRLEAYTYFAGRDDRRFTGFHTNRWFLRRVLKNANTENEDWPIVDADGKWSVVSPILVWYPYIESDGIIFAAGERPAFVLDLTSVLFTSYAGSDSKFRAPEDGSSFGIFVGLHDPYEGGNSFLKDQKVTLLDETYQAFTAQGNDPDSAAVSPEGTVEISFANALTDTETEGNRFVSAMLCDSEDEVLGYASMKPEAASGTWVLTLPPGLDVSAGDYTLKVFNEQQNGAGCSDYASPFSIIPLTEASVPEFGTSDLTMPADLRAIDANAFEGVEEIRTVDARNCTYIGAEAFRGCNELTQIMVDAECEIEEGAFSTDGTVWVYADGAGKAKTFCDTHEGFEFVQVE